MLKNRQKRYFKHWEIGKKIYKMFNKMKHQWTSPARQYINKGSGANKIIG